MRDSNIKEKIGLISLNNKAYLDLKNQSILIIKSLQQTFHQEMKIDTYNLLVSSFCFRLWGLNFFVRSELEMNPERNIFTNGQLNTYTIHEEKELLLLSYSFDSRGNIEDENEIKTFGMYYYADFVMKAIDYSNKFGVRFRLL